MKSPGPHSSGRIPRLVRIVIVCTLLIATGPNPSVHAWEWRDLVDIGMAYMTHLYFHELGHQVIADEVGADNHQIQFLKQEKGQYYLGLSTYDRIPDKSKLAYAVGGDRMTGLTFEYALSSYREKPTTFNKSLLFFTTVDFVGYTLLSNYVHSTDNMYDPNLIREETGMSKELLLGMVATKALVNTYRLVSGSDRLTPEIRTDTHRAAFVLNYHF
ncbi:MAG: hypothetical protein QNJ22_23700 [Desulfosarcinaceae bacterium]|nr:hypothetical protein [Desulfosarcinaceae bacterium]